MGKLLSNTSLEKETRKKLISACDITDIIIRVKAYEINIESRMLQASNMCHAINEELWNYIGEEKDKPSISNIVEDFYAFNSPWNSKKMLRVNHFEGIFIEIENLAESLRFLDFVKVNFHLWIILEFLSMSYGTIEKNAEWKLDMLEVDYERIVQIKTCIKHALKYSNLDVGLTSILNEIYQYYTQFWRILEMYGDLYNDVNIFIDTFLERNISLFQGILEDNSIRATIDTNSYIIELENGLRYNPERKDFSYRNSENAYHIWWWPEYKHRIQFMDVLCKKWRQDRATYEELQEATWKDTNQAVQTVYKNIRDGLESYFWIGKNISNFCTNIPKTWYTLKRR